MSHSQVEFLSVYGWSELFADPAREASGQFAARVISEERGLYRVQAKMELSLWAAISGGMQFEATARPDYPAVGDWVWVALAAGSDRGVIHAICPRRTVIQRKEVGTGSDVQILSANVDYVLITTSMNEDFNPRRLDRYLAVAREGGAEPVVLLTKSDLFTGDQDGFRREVEAQFAGVAVHALSRDRFDDADFFKTYLAPGKTAVVLGSSGVGKSTLVNYLIGEEAIRTQEIRERDGKGRHTTTSRSLYRSTWGGLIIDTPGMRELHLSDHVEGVHAAFQDVDSLVLQCKFSDCKHVNEPGCAIQMALNSGELPRPRWEAYLKLEAEARFEARKRDKALAAEDRGNWKKVHKEARARSRFKKKGGG